MCWLMGILTALDADLQIFNAIFKTLMYTNFTFTAIDDAIMLYIEGHTLTWIQVFLEVLYCLGMWRSAAAL